MSPKRVQMSRQHPWRADNPDAVIVARPSKWGNPFAAKIPASYRGGPGELGQATMTRQYLADDFREWLTVELFAGKSPKGWDAMLGVPYANRPTLAQIVAELAGRDLACWCPLDQPCHADVLLEIANAGSKVE